MQLQEVINSTPKNDVLLVIGDCNAKVTGTKFSPKTRYKIYCNWISFNGKVEKQIDHVLKTKRIKQRKQKQG